MIEHTNIDIYLPPEMAEKAVAASIKKADAPASKLFLLAVLAGLFIGVGGMISTTATSGAKDFLPYGIIRLVTGLTFSFGLMMVIIAGSELFTGNLLFIMAYLGKKVSFLSMLRNWGIVYLGNFVGSMFLAVLVFLGRHQAMGNGLIGLNILNIAEVKTSLGFSQALVLGVLCNFLVCIAVWMSYSARSTTDKVLVVIPPITAFVAAGFEHSVANMYFISVAILVKYFGGSAFFNLIQKTPADFPHISISNFLIGNLLPVTLGNIIGGGLFVGAMYWFIYLRKQ